MWDCSFLPLLRSWLLEDVLAAVAVASMEVAAAAEATPESVYLEVEAAAETAAAARTEEGEEARVVVAPA